MAGVARMGCCNSLLYSTAGASIEIVDIGWPNTLSKSVGLSSS